MKSWALTRIISGGQTGADQAGLRAAHACGIATGGWVPRGWRTDEGAAPWLAVYGCREHRSTQYAPRTIANVREADCVIWFGDIFSPGGRLTLGEVDRQGIPQCCVPFPDIVASHLPSQAQRIGAFLDACHDVAVLLIAGNREATNPGIGAFVEGVLLHVLQQRS